ncbi:hypothetical protein BC629DRAFT_667159 [Irpex lacteus]|nr:hypothetical protein BC629DRAFT_667159 [Irpex lacteus]
MNLPTTAPANGLTLDAVSYVFDFLQDDKKTLKQCSLVSHQWREAARARLFRVVVLSDCLQYFGFKDSVVLTQRPVLANIRHLTIEASTGHYFHQTPDEPEYPLSLISALPNLETLQLQGSLPRQGLFVETIRRVPQKQFKLKKLAFLCGDSFRASNYVRYVLNVLGLFSQIDFLTVSHGPDSEIESQTHFEILDLAEYIKAFQSYNHHIEKLLVGKVKVQVNTRSADLRFWFQVLYRICQLSELAELYIEKPSDLPSVDAYRIPQPYDLAVSDIAQNLRVLRVQIGDIRALALEAYRRSVHFRTCYHLTEFYLEARGHALEPPNPNQNSSWVVFCGIINSLPPTVNRTLRSLKIHWNFRGPLPRVYQGYNWEPLKVASDASGHFVWSLSRTHYPRFGRLRQLPLWRRACINSWPCLIGSPSSFSQKGCPFLRKDTVAHRLRVHVKCSDRRASFIPIVYSTLSCNSPL